MKLTEDDFRAGEFPTDLGTSWYGLVIYFEPTKKMADDCEKETEEWGEKLKQQILDNQKLRELIKKAIKENEPYKKDPDSGGLYYELRKLLEDSKK